MTWVSATIGAGTLVVVGEALLPDPVGLNTVVEVVEAVLGAEDEAVARIG